MVVIRLARGGAKKRPFYHIVAADKRRALNGRYVPLHMNFERVQHWLAQGAQPSPRLKNLLKDFAKLQAEAAKTAEAAA
jgi:small subunit ribosomal protein S16